MNCVVLVGRLTKNPDLRFIADSGKPVATFSIAVNRSYVNKEGKREADFFNIVVWGKPGENCANYLEKGRLVSIKGALQTRSYEAQNGDRRYVTEVVAERVEFLESKNKNQNQGPSNTGQDKTFEPTGLDTGGFQALDDDDIPF